MTRKLVLASTSPFRKTLLEKLNVSFDCAKPDIDETAMDNESPLMLVERLAIEKAQAVACDYPNSLIIGSDQVALCDNIILGKPHNFKNAVKQLTQFNEKNVTFYTGLCVLDSATGKYYSLVEPFSVVFKNNSLTHIENYLHAEQPYSCAGSFKSEGLGICLFEKLQGDDPNTLIGLPLIKLVGLLLKHNFDVLAQ